MKVFSRINTLPKRLFTGALVGLAILLPASTFAADAVRMEGSMGVANVTAGDTQYKQEVNASYDQVVKFQVFYHNMEAEDSGKVAQNVRIKVAIPNTPGQTQAVKGTISGDNTNTIEAQNTVRLDRADAYLEYIPGSAVWKHNTGTNEAPNVVEQKVSDEVVYGNQGLVLENAKPCYNFSATVTVLARVRVPGVTIDKQVRVKGEKTWTTQNTAKPGDTLEYLLTYKNTGNSQQNNVVMSDSLPPKMTYVPGTTYLANQTNPNGVKYNSDALTTNGIVIGNYGPGSNAFVKFEVKVPTADQLACGKTEFRNVGSVRPEGMNEYYNTAITTVEKVCENKPAYACEVLDITKGENRTVTISNFKQSASNGATFKNVVIDWGDNTTPLTTNNAVGQTHQYANDGTYTVSATAYFTVNGKDEKATSANCAKTVSFTVPGAPTTLVKTGPADAAALFGITTVAGAIAHRLFTNRRLASRS